MTGYHIQLGYNSRGRPDQLLKQFREVIEALCAEDVSESLVLMEMERERHWTGVSGVRQAARRFAFSLAHPEKDCSITFPEPDHAMLLASGGDSWRDLKEGSARAFCRLVTLALNRRGIEVSVTVA